MFPLASGGTVYVREPRRLPVDEQPNGAEYAELGEDDWELVLPFFRENDKLFDIFGAQ